jgi:hypothetical protein
MNINQWTDLEYLRTGSQTQAEVYRLLSRYKLLQLLRDYDPILVGTVPIGIHVEGSDLDIICEVKDFEILVRAYFKDYRGFSVIRRQVDGMERIKANFYLENWPVEIFGQNKPTNEQNGFRHTKNRLAPKTIIIFEVLCLFIRLIGIENAIINYPNFSLQLFISIFFVAISVVWILFFSKSKRIKETFVN